jgi:hypothetical protein
VPYKAVADHLETFLASLDADPTAKGLPAYVQREFYDYLRVASSPRAFSAWDVHLQARDAAGLQLQAARILSVVCQPADGPDRGPPGRASNPLGPHAAMGRVGAHPLALLGLLGQVIKYLIQARCLMAVANRENKRRIGCYMWLHVGFRKEKVRRAFAMLICIGYTGNASLLAYFRLGVRVS